jgi:hypothetical protein
MSRKTEADRFGAGLVIFHYIVGGLLLLTAGLNNRWILLCIGLACWTMAVLIGIAVEKDSGS